MTVLETSGFDRTVSMTLQRDLNTGVWFVEQIETRYGPVRNHTRFAEAMPIDSAFSDEFLFQLKELLPTTLAQQIVTIAGPSIMTGTFATEGLRMMTQAARHGVQRVLLRFKRVIGRVMDILRVELRPETVQGGSALMDLHNASSIESMDRDSGSAAENVIKSASGYREFGLKDLD